MERTADWPRVYLDTSAFIYFEKAGHCGALNEYLGDKLRITTDVETELGPSRDATIKLLLLANNWPPGGVQELPPHRVEEAARIITLSQKAGDKKGKNAGEVSTVICAQEDGSALVILEDKFGRALAKQRGVKRLSTAQLAAEMAVVGALTEAKGYAVFEKCIHEDYRDKAPGYWRRAVQYAKAAQAP